jgi:hypothetical protein
VCFPPLRFYNRITNCLLDVYFMRIGPARPAFSAATAASFASCSDRSLRTYRKRRINDNSTLVFLVSRARSKGRRCDVPFFCHHEETLDEKSLEKLRTNTLEQAHHSLLLNDVGHHLAETLERLAVTGCWRPRLETNFGYDQRLGRESCKCF